MTPRIIRISGFSIGHAGRGVVKDLTGIEEPAKRAGRYDKGHFSWEFSSTSNGLWSIERFVFTLWPSHDTEEHAIPLLTHLVLRVKDFDFAYAGIKPEAVPLAEDLEALFEIMDQLGFGVKQGHGRKFMATCSLCLRVDIEDIPDP